MALALTNEEKRLRGLNLRGLQGIIIWSQEKHSSDPHNIVFVERNQLVEMPQWVSEFDHLDKAIRGAETNLMYKDKTKGAWKSCILVRVEVGKAMFSNRFPND